MLSPGTTDSALSTILRAALTSSKSTGGIDGDEGRPDGRTDLRGGEEADVATGMLELDG